jgi:hypothetical protein
MSKRFTRRRQDTLGPRIPTKRLETTGLSHYARARQSETPQTRAATTPVTIVGSGWVFRYNLGVGGCQRVRGHRIANDLPLND